MVVVACVQEVQEVQHLLVVLERVIFDVAMAGTRPEKSGAFINADELFFLNNSETAARGG